MTNLLARPAAMIAIEVDFKLDGLRAWPVPIGQARTRRLHSYNTRKHRPPCGVKKNRTGGRRP